jgi:hypothetical protein
MGDEVCCESKRLAASDLDLIPVLTNDGLSHFNHLGDNFIL